MLEDNDLQRKVSIGKIVKDIRKNTPKNHVDVYSACDYEIKSGFMDGRRIKRLIIYLRSSGCKWVLEDKYGGCTMCGLSSGTKHGLRVSANNFIVQFDRLISEIDLTDIPMVCVYNAGSFLNDEEIPAEAQLYIYRTLNRIIHVKRIIIESRPLYITNEKLKILRREIPNKEIEIGMGLESIDEYVRNVCLNKALLLDKFMDAVHLMKKYKILSLAYVLLKPPFLNENASINDCCESIKWAFMKGVDIVSLEPMSIQKYTIVQLMADIGDYKTPWLWSVLTIVSEIGNIKKGLLRIGGFEFYPTPDVFAHNCPNCDGFVMQAIDEYNGSNNIEYINLALQKGCTNCMAIWKKDMLNNMRTEDAIDLFVKKANKIKVSKWVK
jgi:radical SAM enzyme (TIGR01210 family)